MEEMKTGAAHHKCQFCNEVFVEKQMLEDHVDRCDPYDLSIDLFDSDIGKNGKKDKKSKVENSKKGKRNRKYGATKAEAQKNQNDIEMVGKKLDEESEENHQGKNNKMSLDRMESSSFHQMIHSATKVSSVDRNTVNKNVKEDLKIGLDSTSFELVDQDFTIEEACSSNIVDRRRSSRKRKLKKFEDYETVYTDSTNRKQMKSSSNDSNQDNNEITKDENSKIQDDKLLKRRAAKTLQAKGGQTQTKCVMFFCPLCEVTDEVLEKIQDHIRNKHDQKRLSWVVLSSNYKQMQEVNKDPAFSVKEGKTKCLSCRKECHSTKQLMLHVNKCHAYYPYCCGICRLAFASKEAVKLHMKKIHLKESYGQVFVKYYADKVQENQSKDNVKGKSKDYVKSKTEFSKCIRQENSKDIKVEDTAPPTYDLEGVKGSKNDADEVVTLEGHDQKKIEEENDVRKSKEKGNRAGNHSMIGLSKKRTRVYNNRRSAINVKKVEEVNVKGNSRFSVNHSEESNLPLAGNELKNMNIRDGDMEGFQIYEHQDDDLKEYQGENAASFVKFSVIAQENQMADQHPVVIKSIKVVPKKGTSKVNEMELKDKETESVRVQSLQENVNHRSENDMVDTDNEVVEFDAKLSDTDEDDFDDDNNPIELEMKFKRKMKEHDTQQLFNFSRLKGVDFKCLFEKCEDLLPSFEVWQNHLIKHTKKRKRPPFTCMECGYSTRDKKVLNQHLLIKHNSLETVEISIQCCEILHRETSVPLKIIACVFCGFLNDLENFTTMHKCYRKRLNFYCPFCIQKDSVFESLQNHIRGEHCDKTLHRQEMGYRYQSLRKSQKDPASYMNDHDTKCSDCGLVFKTNDELKIHVNEKHAIFPYSCGVCRQCYGRHTAVMDHMRKTHSLPMACQHCGRGFGDKADLCRHEASHQKTKPFKCDICGSRYADQKGLRTHRRLKHAERDDDGNNVPNYSIDSELFICDICGLSFSIFSQFKKHCQRHCDGETEDVPKVNCDICSKPFTRNAYKRHLCTKEIEGDRPDIIQGYSDTVESIKDIFLKIRQIPAPGSGAKVSCGLCHKDFNKNKYMYNHIRQVHIPNEGKKIHCSICNAGFNRRPQLMAHMRSHSNVKPYKCRICSKYFRQLGHVKVHLLSHSKKPSFKCKLCSKVFKAKCSLANHVLTHCDIYPYTCFVQSCKRAFNSLQNLLLHVRQCASHIKTSIGLECKICTQKLNCLKNGLAHMKSHSKDRLYKCSKCFQNFTSYRQLYIHKDRVNHFSESELESGACKSNSVQNFKCVEVDENLETLQQLYDYLPEEINLEKSSTGAKQDSDQGDHLDYKDAEEIEVDNVIESDMLMDIAEQLTHMAERETKKYVLSPVQIKAFDVNTIETNLQTPAFVSESSQARELNCNFSAKDESTILNQIEIESQNEEQRGYKTIEIESNKQTDFEIEERDETNTSNSNFFTTDDCNVHVQILGSQPVIDENAVLVATEIPDEKETTFNEETQGMQETIQNISVEMQSEDQLATNVVSEEMLAASKIFDEFGKEVKVNLVNDKGYHVPIQSNPELLQTLLSTGKYSLHFADSESIVEEVKVMQNLDENAEAATENELFQKPNSVLEFENLDFNLTEGTDIYVINEIPSVEEYKYTVDIEDRFETSEKRKKVKTDNIQKERKLMNMDKVLGDIVDKDAAIGNHKMEAGQINYKVRLHYYEDRTKQEEQYPLKCDVCSYRFRRVKDLNAHKKKHLPNDAKPFQCKDCGKGYTTRHAFMAHMLVHTGERPHRCDQCEKSFRQLGHLQTHLRTHANYRPFKCRYCDKTFVTNSQLKQHAPSHGTYFQQTIENGVNCLVCGNVFSNEKELGTHRLKHLSISDQEDLLKQFNILSPDESHSKTDKKTKPGVQGSYMCDVCGKMFKHPSDLKDHVAVHSSDAKVSCKHCGNEFLSERRLQTHINNIHSAERWQCDTCGLQLKSKFSFKSHMLHHKGPKFKCAQCNKEFARKHRFLQHLPSCLGDSFMQKFQNLTDHSPETGTTENCI